MRKSFLFILIAFSFSVIEGQNWTEFTASESTVPSYNIIQSNDTIVMFNVVIPGMFETVIDTFNRVNIKEHAKMDSIGYPEMPIVSFLVAIPECDSVNLLIELLDSTQFSGYNIYPAPELVPDTTAGGAIALVEKFAYYRPAYETDAMFPGYIVETIEKGAIRDQHVVRIVLYPVQFNPVKDIIKAYSDFQVTLTFNNPSGPVNNDVGIFNEVVGNTLINYQSNGLNASVNCGAGLENSGSIYWINELPNNKVDSVCDYLIITPRDFFIDTVAKNKIEELAQHRANFNGFDVAIVRTSTIDTFINVLPDMFLYEKIQYLIKETYESNNANHTYDGKLAYVNLFGDVELQDGSPGVPTYSEGFDVYFTQLTWYLNSMGDTIYDDYPDLMIGRCSVDDTTQVKNVVHKILNFKPKTIDWNDEFLAICGSFQPIHTSSILFDLDEDIPSTYNKELIALDTVVACGVPPWSWFSYNKSNLLTKWAEGKMFINYMGHGSPKTWSIGAFKYDDLSSIHNNRLPFVFSAACSTGAFHNNDTCMAEAFLCNDNNRGAVAFVGASKVSGITEFYLLPHFYHSFFRNYSTVSGEAMMEAKIKLNYNGSNIYNLFGDPALHLLYENADTIYPELYVRPDSIFLSPDYPNHNDTVFIGATVQNGFNVDANNDFYVSCYAIDTVNTDTIWIGNSLIEGLEAYTTESVEFTWLTAGTPYGSFGYDIVISIDTSMAVTEMNENNNIAKSAIKLYHYEKTLTVANGTKFNSHPVSFDINASYEGEEIIFGDRIISASGTVISGNSDKTKAYTSIANLTNNTNYQVVQVNVENNPAELVSIGNPSWSYSLPLNTNRVNGPVITDMDNNGLEEVVFLEFTLGDTIYCVNNDGSERWKHAAENLSSSCPVVYHDQSKIIIYFKSDGKIMFIKENTSTSVQVIDSITGFDPNFSSFIGDPVVSDLNKDGVLELIITYRSLDAGNKYNMICIDLSTRDISDSLFFGSNNYWRTIISDINNDGIGEIITCSDNNGILVLDDNLDTVANIIEENLFVEEIVTFDFNNDGANDIVCQTRENYIDYYLNIFDSTGNILFKTPLIYRIEKCWTSDIDKNSTNEFIYSNHENLFVIEFPNSGSSTGWPGQQGNVRNTGVLEHPAYFAPFGDTVYWMNTISLADSNIVPSNSTVIIKPGTTIKAHAGSILVVDGTLIAEGSENHPIVFTADINGADNDYWQGIIISNKNKGRFQYCEVRDAKIGLLAEDYSDVELRNCLFENNIVGIGAYNSSPLIKENIVTNNNTGIKSYKIASPVLTDLIYEQQFRNGIINNDNCIVLSGGTVLLYNGYNDIYKEPDHPYYIYIEPSGSGIQIINATYNYWGTTNIPDIYSNLFPSYSFIIEPVLESSQSCYKSSGSMVWDMLKSAMISIDNNYFNEAESILKTIIQQYPESQEAYFSVAALFDCYSKSNSNWNNLENYYTGLYNDSTMNEKFKKLSYGYMNLCKRANGDFSGAIGNYESILLNDPTYNDSVFAVIDIGNTYEEAGNYKSSLGQLSYLVPVSRAGHAEKTVDLLLSLKPDNRKNKCQPENEFSITEIFPNPFRNETTVFYKIPYTCNVSIKVFDATGRLIQTEQTGNTTEGNYEYILQMPESIPGIYYVALEANGKQVGVKKIVVN